jgi:hypothetical protein
LTSVDFILYPKRRGYGDTFPVLNFKSKFVIPSSKQRHLLTKKRVALQNVDVKALLREYDSVTGIHSAMEPEAFNDDHIYKSCLDEVCFELPVPNLFLRFMVCQIS